MNKKTLVKLADYARANELNTKQIEALADLCASLNPLFKRSRWFDYVAGKCGPNGGVK